MSKPTPEFVFAGKMPISTRLMWIAGLAVVGIAIQLLYSIFLGWPLVLVAGLLGTVRSRTNEPTLQRKREWNNVTIEELEQAQELITRTQKWRSETGVFSGGSAKGCTLGCASVLGIMLAGGMLLSRVDSGGDLDLLFEPVVRGGWLSLLFTLDTLTLLAPVWLFGRVTAWEPPDLKIRVAQLMHIYKTASANPRLEWQPSLQVRKSTDGSVPMDCRLMAKVKDSDKDFMGIQVQTSLNRVQSKTYPYTYCVLIAKPEFGLIRKLTPVIDIPPPGGFRLGLLADANAKKEAHFARFGGALVEVKKEGDVEIAVVRQPTSGTGYHTSPDQAMEVFSAAYQLAVRVLQSGAQD